MSDLAPDAAAAPADAASDLSLARILLELSKPRIVAMVLVTATIGYFLGGRGIGSWWTLLLTLAGTGLGAAGAAALNNYLERDTDARMQRTRRRALPSGALEPASALAYGVLLVLAGVTLLVATVNLLSAFLVLLTAFLYVLVYTPLKKLTWLNTPIGAIPGALPPVIGWAAATGDIGWGAVALFAIIFLWTPPHSWALALFRRQDYDRAGVPMLPVVAGDRATRRQMLAYTLVLVPASLVPVALGIAGTLYGVTAAVLGAFMLGHAVRVVRDDGPRTARAMFFFSIVYLFAIFVGLLADRALAAPTSHLFAG